MLATRCELSLRAQCHREGFGVHSEVTKLGQVLFEASVVLVRPRAVKKLDPRHGAQAQFLVVSRVYAAANVCRLVDEKKAHRQATSESNASESMSSGARFSAAR